MKKIFSISFSMYLLVGGLIPNGDFSQLTLIPDLFEHFNQHQHEATEQGADISFMDFIDEHYFNTNGHEHDGDNDHPCMPMQHITPGLQFVFSVPHLHVHDLSLQVYQPDYLTPQALSSSDYSDTTDRPPSLV